MYGLAYAKINQFKINNVLGNVNLVKAILGNVTNVNKVTNYYTEDVFQNGDDLFSALLSYDFFSLIF